MNTLVRGWQESHADLSWEPDGEVLGLVPVLDEGREDDGETPGEAASHHHVPHQVELGQEVAAAVVDTEEGVELVLHALQGGVCPVEGSFLKGASLT